MKSILTILLALLSTATVARSPIVCDGSFEKASYGALMGSVYYTVKCSDGTKEHFSDGGCYSKSCKDEFLQNSQEELEKKGINLIASKTINYNFKYDFYIKDQVTPEMKNHFAMLSRTMRRNSAFDRVLNESLTLYIGESTIEQTKDGIRMDDYRNVANLMKSFDCKYIGYNSKYNSSDSRKDFFFLICKK